MTTIPLAQFTRLEKFMGLTMSEHDGESLAAIRQANKILVAYKITWQDVFKRLITIDVEEAEPQPKTQSSDQKEEIDEAFRILRPALKPGGFRRFIEDLYEQWTENGWLSPAQRAALFKAVKNNRMARSR